MKSSHARVQGFTLIEILVVVVIVSITLGFALLSFGDFGQHRRLVLAAEQFVQDIHFIQQQAILESNTLGVSIDNNGYQLVRYRHGHGWHPLSKTSILKHRSFPDHTLVSFKTNATKTHPIGRAHYPQIIIPASGDISPFILNMHGSQSKKMISVISKQDGSLALNTQATYEE